ncbi:MAG: beta-lactamase family protein [Clostridia bacterium]|nr:beta-lactamase family protein [Clostridia bacterium]
MFIEKLQAFAREYSEKNSFSGILRITQKDEILLTQYMGYADRENKLPFDESSMFTFYSISKAFCAIGLMRLYDKGLVDINAHPSVYLPECAALDKDLTLVHVMRHNSGIPDFFMEEKFKELRGTEDDIKNNLSALFECPAYFKAGTDAKYANINYNIMALIIEKVTDLPYAEYMKNEVLLPLGASTAIVDRDGLFIQNRVQGYAKDEDGNIYRADRNPGWMKGAGDIVGRVEDVYALNLAIKNKVLLTKESWQKVLTPSPFNSMGFGCTVKSYDGKIRITHNGGHTGFRTYHVYMPQDDLDMILLSNCGWGLGRTDFETKLYEFFYGYDITNGKITPMDVGYI